MALSEQGSRGTSGLGVTVQLWKWVLDKDMHFIELAKLESFSLCQET